MFTRDELCLLMMLSGNALDALRRCGAPFPFNKSRPEWLLEFMKAHPTLSIKSDRVSLAASTTAATISASRTEITTTAVRKLAARAVAMITALAMFSAWQTQRGGDDDPSQTEAAEAGLFSS